jgi:UDP-glucose 4-epimerase
MRWLITGGCGFIGRNLIKTLLQEKGHFIRVIDNLTVGTRDDLAMVTEFEEIDQDNNSILCSRPGSESSLQLIVGDVLDEKLALVVCRNIDVIVHLAANTGVGPSVDNPRMDCRVNVFGTLNYLEAARYCNVKRLIFASSGAPAGECEPPIHEGIPPHPVSPYGASKLAGEGYCSAYWRTFNVETACLRFGNVYGPLSNKKDSVVAKFIKRAIGGFDLKIYGDGKQTRDFIYIDDLVQAVLLAAVKDNIGGEVFQIATNCETSVQEMTDIRFESARCFKYQGVEWSNEAGGCESEFF